MPTGQQIITNALVALNVIDAGGSVSGSENADLVGELNTMIDAWATDEILIPSVATAQYLLTAGSNPYTLGAIPAGFTGAVLLGASTTISGATDAAAAVLTYAALTPALVSGAVVLVSGLTGLWAPANGAWVITVLTATTFSIPIASTGFSTLAGTPVFQLTAGVTRPVRIDAAVQVSTVGAGVTRKPLRIVGSKTYFAHGDLAASGTTIDEIYPDFQDTGAGAMRVYTYPVCSCLTATSLELEVWNPIAAFALAVNQNLPAGYQDAIQQGLSYRCLARYGAAVNAETAQIVTDLGKQAKARIAKLNVQNRLLDPQLLEAAPQPQGAQPQAAR